MRAIAGLVAVAACATVPAGPSSFDAPPSVVVVGDVHGQSDALGEILRVADLIDAEGHWTGGTSHLVQLGDIVHRGPRSRRAIDLLRQLEAEAREAGGRVHVLVGNHEAMNVYGDLRYVHEGEWEEFVDASSEQRRAEHERTNIPLGWLEHRAAWAPDGEYGRWLARKNATVRIGDSLFVHAGISPAVLLLDLDLADLNRFVRAELADGRSGVGTLVEDPQGPLWYRGLAETSTVAERERALEAHVDAVLARYGVRRIVVGHTPTGTAVLPRFGGKVVFVDIGESGGETVTLAGLLITDEALFALHRGHQLRLPSDEQDLPRYLREVAELEPSDSPRRERIADLLRRLESRP